MTLVTRAASFAAAFLTLAASINASSPSAAAELSASVPVVVQPAAVGEVPPAAPAQAIPAVATISTPDLTPDAQVLAPEADEDDTVAYPTLAAAVAAQDAAVSDEQLRCLAGAIYWEARGEPLAGQLAVAEVIINRASSRRFGGTLCNVVTQPGQFSFARGGRVPSPAVNADWRTAVAVARVAIKDAWNSEADEALYFHARRAAPGWSRVRVASIGNHVFYR